jgi:hypothetical protein
LATAFVDHFSDYTYIFFQTDATLSQSLLAKKEFEQIAEGMGVRVKRYHTDNGRFVDNAWKDHVQSSNQIMNLCGVNAHHQNGRVEKRIRNIQDLAQSSIFHAKQLWPDAIEVSLWPYAIRKCANDMNHIERDSEDMVSLSKFSG